MMSDETRDDTLCEAEPSCDDAALLNEAGPGAADEAPPAETATEDDAEDNLPEAEEAAGSAIAQMRTPLWKTLLALVALTLSIAAILAGLEGLKETVIAAARWAGQ